MSAPNLVALSLGAGVQSTTIALLAVEGALPKPDVAIFADTGWEPAAVYAHLDRLTVTLEAAGISVVRVNQGNLRTDAVDPDHRYASIPYYVRNPNGSDGMARRQCTSEYKLAPIRRHLRMMLGAKPPKYRSVPRGRVCEQWIGFSTDEMRRVNSQRDNGGVLYLTSRYPLLDLGMSRKDCQAWLDARGWSTTKSACIGCPFHGNRQWRALRDTCECGHVERAHRDDGGMCTASVSRGPAANGVDYGASCECLRFSTPEWADAVAFDEAIRKGGAHATPINGEAFLHRSRLPLSIAPIDHVTRAEHKENDAAGQMELEFGDADGCSPYGCRSGSEVAQ